MVADRRSLTHAPVVGRFDVLVASATLERMAERGRTRAILALFAAALPGLGGCALDGGPSQAALDRAAAGIRSDLAGAAPAAAKRPLVVYCQLGTFMDVPMQCGIVAGCFDPAAARQLERYAEEHPNVVVPGTLGSHDLRLVVESGRAAESCAS